ncbi:hypothetical protein OG402_20230 [Streptomyces anulatus]|uniref:hypothetical protein n=1 Tax=Streptomyces anulatus TaxID=1892 RepID=UPI00224E5FBC|nr:hypothetical protein [Streptomyces anulatus]MCX4602796.1 hypothetical protein [Streptomyces anulatus]
MDAELAALASTGATTLVALMVTDAWSGARTRVARLLARNGEGREDALEAELEQARERLALTAASGQDGSIEAEWRARFVLLLAENPQAAKELGKLVAEFGPRERDRKSEGGVAFHHSTVYGVNTGDGGQTNDFRF